MSPVSRKRKKKDGSKATSRQPAPVLHFEIDERDPIDRKPDPRLDVPGAVKIKITLRGSEPLVWRRLEVPARLTLAALHYVIQDAFSWENAHPHQFMVTSRRFGRDRVEVVRDEGATGLPEVGSTFHYVYDFGDEWLHDIEVEEHLSERAINQAVCLDGASAAPEDDSGGVGGWVELCEILADPVHPEYEECLEWVGYVPDPTEFDLKTVNRVFARTTFH